MMAQIRKVAPMEGLQGQAEDHDTRIRLGKESLGPMSFCSLIPQMLAKGVVQN